MDDIEGTGSTRDDLVNEIAAVASTVLSGETLEDTLQQVVETAVATIDGCDAAGVFVVDGKAVRTVAHTDESVIDLDRLQEVFGEGPCLDAATSAAVIYVEDLSEDDRYPRFGGAASTAGIRTVLACPVSSDNLRGALNLYAALPSAFGATDPREGNDPRGAGGRRGRRRRSPIRPAITERQPPSGTRVPRADRPGPGHPHGTRASER